MMSQMEGPLNPLSSHQTRRSGMFRGGSDQYSWELAYFTTTAPSVWQHRLGRDSVATQNRNRQDAKKTQFVDLRRLGGKGENVIPCKIRDYVMEPKGIEPSTSCMPCNCLRK